MTNEHRCHGLRGKPKNPGNKVNDHFVTVAYLGNPILCCNLPDHCFFGQISMNAETAPVKMALLVSINQEITNANL